MDTDLQDKLLLVQAQEGILQVELEVLLLIDAAIQEVEALIIAIEAVISLEVEAVAHLEVIILQEGVVHLEAHQEEDNNLFFNTF